MTTERPGPAVVPPTAASALEKKVWEGGEGRQGGLVGGVKGLCLPKAGGRRQEQERLPEGTIPQQQHRNRRHHHRPPATASRQGPSPRPLTCTFCSLAEGGRPPT